MTRYGPSTREIVRRLVIAYHHPDYRDARAEDALRELHEKRDGWTGAGP